MSDPRWGLPIARDTTVVAVTAVGAPEVSGTAATVSEVDCAAAWPRGVTIDRTAAMVAKAAIATRPAFAPSSLGIVTVSQHRCAYIDAP